VQQGIALYEPKVAKAICPSWQTLVHKV